MYQVGETIRLTASITNDDGAADPATVKITVNSPNNSKVVAAQDMENPTVGSYYYDYLIPNNTGKYSWKATATGAGGRITIVKDSFNVDASI